MFIPIVGAVVIQNCRCLQAQLRHDITQLNGRNAGSFQKLPDPAWWHTPPTTTAPPTMLLVPPILQYAGTTTNNNNCITTTNNSITAINAGATAANVPWKTGDCLVLVVRTSTYLSSS